MIEKLDQNSSFIQKARSDVDFSPSNRTEVNRFLNDTPWEKTPLGCYVTVQREVKEDRARILRESMEEEDREKEASLKKQDELDEIKDDEEDDEEDVEMSD